MSQGMDWGRFSSDFNNHGLHRTMRTSFDFAQDRLRFTKENMLPHLGLTETIRLLAWSRWKRLSGGMTVVALYSVMMAGPGYFWPGRRSSREWIVVSCFLPSKRTGTLGEESLPSVARPGRAKAPVPTWSIVPTWFHLPTWFTCLLGSACLLGSRISLSREGGGLLVRLRGWDGCNRSGGGVLVRNRGGDSW